ncbi:hypothetical protein S83_012452, partial [Arachis hypogaea]
MLHLHINQFLVLHIDLKDIINSLLPACTTPDLETSVAFRSQAIIANPPAYGHAHVAEALGANICISSRFDMSSSKC